MRVGILTQYYPPEMGAAQARLSELAARLSERGHEVLVLTAMPNYPQGAVWNGHGGVFRRERRDGVEVLRSWIWPSRSARVLPRTASYLSFAASSLVAGALRLPSVDVLLTESPPLTLGLSGYVLSRLKRARWVFNVSDLWPESAVVLGILGNGRTTRAAYALEAFCYRKAWRVSGQSGEILGSVERRFPGVATLPLPNGVDTERFDPGRRSAELRRELFDDAPVVALYAGLHGLAQGLGQVLDAAERVREEDLLVVLAGDGAEKPELVRRARRRGLDNVRFLDPLPRDRMPALVASADLALVPLKGAIPGAVPSKLYEALASGVPVVLVAGGEAAEIVESTGAGVVVAPDDAEGLAAALRRLAGSKQERRRLGEAGRRAAVERFDRTAIFDRFIDGLEAAA